MKILLPRTFFLGIIAFIYSTMGGILVMNFFAGYYLQNSESLENFYETRVFVKKPDYEISSDRSPEFISHTLYRAIQNYDPEILAMINKVAIDESKWNTRYQATYLEDKEHALSYGRVLAVLHHFTQGDGHSQPCSDPSTSSAHPPDIRSQDQDLLAHRLDLLRAQLEKALAPSGDYTREFGLEKAKQLDGNWICLLKLLDDPAVYQQTLSELTPTKASGYSNRIITKVAGIEIYNNMLITFSIFAMFIGVFLQFIFSEKSVSDPA